MPFSRPEPDPAPEHLDGRKDRRVPVLLTFSFIAICFHLFPWNSRPVAGEKYFHLKQIDTDAGALYRITNPETGFFLSFFPEKDGSLPQIFSSKGISFHLTNDSGEISPAVPDPRISLFFNKPVSFHDADFSTLCMLPGIGKRMAERLIRFRDNHPECETIEDLETIPGVGRSFIKKMKPYLSFTPLHD